MALPDYSADFYRSHAQEYSTISHEFRQSTYIKNSHSAFENDWDAWEGLRRIIPGKKGLDAGCGAGARDVFHLWAQAMMW